MRTLNALVIALLSTVASAAQAGDFEDANRLYDQGKFSEAKQRYERLAESGPVSANLFYNLGNADYRLGAPGPALLDYERALALDPAHAEARANLAVLRRQTGAKLWPQSWVMHLFPGQRVDIYTMTAVICGWLAVFCFSAIWLTPRQEKAGLWASAIAGLLLAGYAAGAVWFFEQDRTLAIVTAKEIEARLAPAASAGSAGMLTAGSQVRVLSERGDWIYCALPGSGRGWIASGAVERIRPRKS